MAPYDILGNLALVKFPRGTSASEKKKYARLLLKQHSNITSVLEKTGKIRGRLRTPQSKWIEGVKTKEVLYRENGCEFRFNVDTCYFSPRLSTERQEIASMVRRGERVLVLFGGVGPFAVVIAKQRKASEVISVELGREPHRYALENIKRNKVSVQAIQGDVRRVVPKISGNFDRIVMARPNLEDSFLDVAFKKVKRKGIIHYYGFYDETDLESLRELISQEAHKAKRIVKIMLIKKAGDIGKRKYRYRADVKLLN